MSTIDPTAPVRPARYAGLIQPIVVLRSGTHEDMVTAVARASVGAWLAAPHEPIWEPWLAAAFAKTVRRAKPAEFAKAAAHGLYTATVNDARAVALAPYPTDALPPVVSKLQVSGLNAERHGFTSRLSTPSWAPTLVINEAAAMTTGKTCAQAAHGLFAWALDQDPDMRTAWHTQGLPCTIRSADAAEFARLAATAPVVIRDAGHTEVDPGTATVLTLDGQVMA